MTVIIKKTGRCITQENYTPLTMHKPTPKPAAGSRKKRIAKEKMAFYLKYAKRLARRYRQVEWAKKTPQQQQEWLAVQKRRRARREENRRSVTVV